MIYKFGVLPKPSAPSAVGIEPSLAKSHLSSFWTILMSDIRARAPYKNLNLLLTRNLAAGRALNFDSLPNPHMVPSCGGYTLFGMRWFLSTGVKVSHFPETFVYARSPL